MIRPPQPSTSTGALAPFSRRRPSIPAILNGVALIGLAFLAGCATPQPPTQALQAAELAIANADRARAAEFASPELGVARQELASARDAVQKKEMERGRRLAEQSRASAELALAKTDVARARSVNNEMQMTIDTMKVEMQRKAGANQ